MALSKTITAFASAETASSTLTVTCPTCDLEFEVGDSILAKLRQEAEADFRAWKLLFEKEVRERSQSLDEREAHFKRAQAEQSKLIADTVESELKSKISAQYPDLLRRARETAKNETDQRVQTLQSELDGKSQELSKLQRDQAVLEKSQRDFKAERDRFELDKQRAISAAIDDEKEILRRNIGQEFDDKFQVQNVELDRARKQIDDLNQKLKAKPSQELQGEALEWDFEGKLREAFTLDELTPVKKGQRGADILQSVLNRLGSPSGTILWETKRAQTWSGDWIQKLKADQREARATVGVVVSQVTPAGIETFDFIEGVWIVKPAFAVALAVAIREGLLQTADARKAAEGIETKATLVYGYLMSDDFKSRFGSIVDTFVDMQKRLVKEKNGATKNFNAREKQHETVLKSCFGIIGDLQGIAGQDLKSLEEIELKALPTVDEGEME